MSKVTGLALFLIVALLCCAPSSSQESMRDHDTQKRRFARFLEDYVTTFNAKDAPGLALFYSEDAVHGPPTGPELAGRAAVEGYYADFFAQLKPQIVRYLPEYRFAQDWVFVRERWEMRIEPLASGPVSMAGSSLWIGKSTCGGWQIFWHLNRIENPPADLKP